VKVYAAEKEAGLEKALQESAKAVLQVPVQSLKSGEVAQLTSLLKKLRAAQASPIKNVEDIDHDLALVVAVLVTAGWNKNDDIFIPEELWKARMTPIHKPMNLEHDETKIVGHIIDVKAIDDDHQPIDSDDVPDQKFHLQSVGVVYKALPALADRIEKILEMAEAGTMFVSMEAWFPDFAYGLFDPKTNQTKIVERTEANAFLTKHLRSFGGTGSVEGVKIGRVLKGITFGGQGFVEVPANPESVIMNVEASTQSEGGARSMEGLEVLQGQVADLKASVETRDQTIAELTVKLEEAKAADSAAKVSELTEQVETLTSDLATANEGKADVEAKVTELTEKLDEVTKAAEATQAELDGIKAEAKAKDRLAKLAKVRKIEDEKATLAEIKDLDDAAFETVLKFAGQANEEKPEDEDDEDEDELDAEDESKAALDQVDDKNDKSDAAMNQESDDEGTQKSNAFKTVASRLLGQDNTEGGE